MAKGAGFEPISGIAAVRGTASLLTVARPLPAGVRWQTGVTWRRTLACAPLDDSDDPFGPGFRREYCSTDDREDVGDVGSPPEFYPYDIYVPYACDWVLPQAVGDGEGQADYIATATDALEAVSAWHVSRELMIGDTENENPSLVSVATDVSTGIQHPVKALMALLEAWSDCTQQSGDGRRGPIVHATLGAVTALLAAGVVAQVGDVLHGPAGSLVSPGPGYPNAVPTDGSDGAEDAWLYISGPVEYALGPVVVDPAEPLFNQRTNQFYVWASRQAIHRFDPCCVFAAAVEYPTYPNELA